MSQVKADYKWTRNHEDAEKRRRELLASMYIFDELREFLEEFIDDARNSREGSENFDKPNWAYLEAYKLGEIRGYKKLLEFLPKRNEANPPKER